MRIAYVTESFPPDVNGVAHTAVRVSEQLASRGHEPLVIAPEPANGLPRPDGSLGYPVVRVPSLPIPMYPSLRVGLPGRHVQRAMAGHGTELVHLAGPFVLGANGCHAAQRLGLPTVAVYATDMAAYARAYHTGSIGEKVCWWRVRRLHNACDLTLSPSTATAEDLRANGVQRIDVWGRGVDTGRFSPAKRNASLRAELAPSGEVIVGYVGRLAAEKRVDLLSEVAALPGVRLVIVGGGPSEAEARRRLPEAVFLGQRQGDDLAAIYASLDVFVHSGPHETFGNTLQEAAASGLPIVAPAAGGPIDLVNEGVTGFLVAPGDARALAQGVARLAADPALREAQSRAARLSVASRTWASRCDELIEHYDSVLKTAKTSVYATGSPA